MSDQGLHRVADDLKENWVDDWATAGVDELETFLSKHAAFHAFLDENEEL
jgi:hypothetical protein